MLERDDDCRLTRDSDSYRRYLVSWQGADVWLHEDEVEPNGLF